MTIGIVVELEVVHINHGHAQNTAFACQPPHFFLQGFVKVAAVEYASKVVLDADFFQLAVGCLKPTLQPLAQTYVTQKKAYRCGVATGVRQTVYGHDIVLAAPYDVFFGNRAPGIKNPKGFGHVLSGENARFIHMGAEQFGDGPARNAGKKLVDRTQS